MIFAPPYYVFENVIPSAVLDVIDDEATRLKMFPGRIGPDNGQEHAHTRSSVVGFFSHDHWINGLLYHYAAIANARSWRFSLIAPSPAQYAIYRENGHYGWHSDYAQMSQGQAVERKITAVLELTDPGDYRGGDLELRPAWADPLAPAEGPLKGVGKGSIIAFPSLTPHQVASVTEGERRTVTSWIVGPPLT